MAALSPRSALARKKSHSAEEAERPPKLAGRWTVRPEDWGPAGRQEPDPARGSCSTGGQPGSCGGTEDRVPVRPESHTGAPITNALADLLSEGRADHDRAGPGLDTQGAAAR
ncbi:MAG TPA: hypothetical protein VIY28_01635 [Pseudonocardiaceae bacterium]